MDSWSELCTGSALFIFNGIDILCGTVLTVYSLYLGLNHFAPDWLYGPILAVGSVLVITATMSWCGASHRSGSCILSFSSYLLILLALLELILSIIIFTHGTEINQFLRDHQQELKLSDKELERFEDSKFLPAYLLLGLFCMETIRFCCSSGYNRARHRRQYEYKTLSTLKDLDDRLINNRTEQGISEKYAALKEKYKKKYTAPDLVPATSPPTSSLDHTLYV